ncbi:AlbA family DNA-binding domain-containing protein [Pseudomonas gingeri]|uniref:ATP-binding protein n=1 Tax=Pseudomonas gingeri TaxID=117681 RepID=A0A7Y8BKH0_9PSED|nr:ATP-binding protein [Pseudomonas gingeri]NWB47039.1 ATP-binding protein [Pseudomonas gingeri]
MNDDELIQELLYRGEGVTLDYKVKQYPFSGADDGQKSELLKDILAFANAWRAETAYILIGVKNDTLELVDLDEDIDDSRLQEFVNGKTEQPVHFSYRSLEYKGRKLGLYTIPVQDRPVYVNKKYGRVEANVAYVRRGSATAIAKLSEIAAMGAARTAQAPDPSPKLKIKVVGDGSNALEEFSVRYDGWELLPIEQYPMISYSDYKARNYNARFNKEMAKYLHEERGKIPLSLEVFNDGDYFADDVKVTLSAPISPGFCFKDGVSLLSRPERYGTTGHAPIGPYTANINAARHDIKMTATEMVVTFYLGKIQAGETRRTSRVYVINPQPALEAFDVRILSDQLRGAVQIRIPVRVELTSEVLTMEHLKGL